MPYMDSVRRILGELDYDLGNYHEESFTFDDPAQPGATPPPEGVDYDEIAVAPRSTDEPAKTAR